jgi:PKD repeat protein
MSGRSHTFMVLGAARRSVAVVILMILLATVACYDAPGTVAFAHDTSFGFIRAVPAGGASPFTSAGPQPPVVYGGGPLMLSTKLYLIFWGAAGAFPSGYTMPIIQFAKDLQTDESLTTDEFSVVEQYTDGTGAHITSNVTYDGDVFDTTSYPALDTSEGCTTALEPCVTDDQIQAEILNQIKLKNWPTDLASAPQAEYLMYTPEDVTSCDGIGDCSAVGNDQFCSYHGQITGITPGNRVATYANLPYLSDCDSGQAPTGVGGNVNADGTLDSEIHELVESATDPAGNAYLDSAGNEIADKCTYPVVSSQQDTYGAPLGGSLTASTAFNQLIGGHAYYTQQIWSNAPTKTPPSTAPAGCVQRTGPSPSFTGPATAQTGRAISFDASGSYDIDEPITRYAWDFGDGSPIDTTSGMNASHVYTKAGTYHVSLTVTDSSGSTNASTQTQVIVISGPPMPAVTHLSTSEGPTAGGTKLTITGLDLEGVSHVDFGSKSALAFSDISATKVSATAPPGTGTVDLTVKGPGGTSTAVNADHFTYLAKPDVTKVFPARGPAAGGTKVTISGSGFLHATRVSFGSKAVSKFAVRSNASIAVSSPAGSGTVDIVVTTPGGVSTKVSRDKFKFVS